MAHDDGNSAAIAALVVMVLLLVVCGGCGLRALCGGRPAGHEGMSASGTLVQSWHRACAGQAPGRPNEACMARQAGGQAPMCTAVCEDALERIDWPKSDCIPRCLSGGLEGVL